MNNPIFYFIYLHFIIYFLVEFNDVACLDSKGAKSTVKYLYDYTMGGSSHYEIPSPDSYKTQLDCIYIALL